MSLTTTSIFAAPPIETVQLCDDNDGTPFLRTYYYGANGEVASTVDRLLNGVTPYVVVGNAISCVSSGAGIGVPIGTVLSMLRTTAPAGWLAMEAALGDLTWDEDDYPELYAVIASPYRNKPIAGKFTLPDMTNRVWVGASPTYPAGTNFGAAEVALTIAQMPRHTHEVSLYEALETDALPVVQPTDPDEERVASTMVLTPERKTNKSNFATASGNNKPVSTMQPGHATHWYVLAETIS